MQPRHHLRSFALVGAGAVAGALGAGLKRAGIVPAGISGTLSDRAHGLSERLDCELRDQPTGFGADLVCICVPDRAVRPVAEALAAEAWEDRMVLHTAGALTAGALEPVEAVGGRTLAFHPLQSFVAPGGADDLEEVWVTLQGSDAACDAGEHLAHLMGMRPLRVEADQKRALHVAATIVSNYTVTLAGVAQDLLRSAGLPADPGMDLLRPLLAGTARNLDAHLPAAALTGPVARGDVPTIREHLRVLRRVSPSTITTYVLLATEAVALARSGGHLSEERAETVLDALAEALPSGMDQDDMEPTPGGGA